MDDQAAYDLLLDFDPTARIREDTLALADAAEGNLAAAVPGCPDWSVADLVWHLLEVQFFWTWVVGGRHQDTDGYAEPPRPADDELVAGLRAGVDGLIETLRAAEPGEPVFSWASRKDAGWVVRHQVQEAAVHRWDAESAAGHDIALDAEAATDGIEEFLRYSTPFRTKGAALLGGPLVLATTDTGFAWTLDEDADGTLRWSSGEDARPGAAVVRASASDLLLYLYRRRPAGELSITGDRGIAERFVLRNPTG
jgi:uncharacterized protein (TIGR03083 family)